MDGSQDVSCKEQISVAVRYVNDTNDVVEHTISFFDAKNTSGETLYELLLAAMTEIGLSMCNVVGCSFDGAANMRSDAIGVIAFIQANDNINCIYTWCLIHRFNLVVKSAIGGSRQIKQVLNLAEESAKIFRSSYIKMNVWIEVARAIPNFNSQRRLKLIGTTRWSSNQDAIESIISDETNFYVLIKALLKICSLETLDGKSLIDSGNILNLWLQYDNVVITFVLHKIFSLITPTTKFLQTLGLNILDGYKSLEACNERLEIAKGQLDKYIEQADQFIQNTNLLLSKDEEIKSYDCDCFIRLPLEDEKQKKIDRIKKVFHTFIHTLQNENERRLLQEFYGESIYHEMLFLDPLYAKKIFLSDDELVRMERLCEINGIKDENRTINELKEFTSEFIQYQNRPQYLSVFSGKIDFRNEWAEDDEGEEEEIPLMIEGESDFEETRADLESVEVHPVQKKMCYCLECIIKYINSDEERTKMYENIFKLYKYVATLPSTQVKCERDFSKLKLIKTRLRSSLCEKSLENLIIISVESKMFKNVNLENVIDEIIASSNKISLYVGL